MSDQLDALCDNSPVLAHAPWWQRLKDYKERVTVGLARQDDLRAENHALCEQLASSQAEVQRLQQQLSELLQKQQHEQP